VSYKYNEDDIHTHFGFVAQDIEESLSELNMTGEDFGAVVKNSIVDDEGEEKEKYYLRYNEFIALDTCQIQKLKARVAELESIIASLE
jgi:glycosylphosphatidylinositol transamidase (GPIT) subunit GPI8